MKAQLLFLCLAGLALGHLQASEKSPVEVRVNLAHPKVPANKQHTTYLKVGLKGLEQTEKPSRPPVNVAIVLDRSGSMAGAKMENAKQAAKEALQHLGADDIVSVIAFDNEVNVVVPATKLTNRDDVMKAIDQITSRGSTALFAGVSKGAEELRKFKNPKQVNRVILLSDGVANIGPSTPEELGRLGVSFAKEGITVTTFGLGLDYNERLMAQLAQSSDGNHAFIKEPKELAEMFNKELGDILSVVAQDLHIQIRCPEGVRPVRVLGREADIRGGTVEVSMNQLRAGQEKYALLEVEIPSGAPDSDQLVGEVEVAYRVNAADQPSKVSSRSVAHRVTSAKEVDDTADTSILIAVAQQLGMEKQILAIKLSDEGKKKEAEDLLIGNAGTLETLGRRYRASTLMSQSQFNNDLNAGQKVGGANWNALKKDNSVGSNALSTQNTYTGSTTIRSTDKGNTTIIVTPPAKK